MAIVVHDAALLEGPALEREIGSAARLAVENERLQAEVLAQLEDLRASRARIVETGDAERRRLERDLHDGAQQRLLALSYDLRLARAAAEAEGDREHATLLASAGDEAQAALGELRELAHGIYPAILAEAGLAPALATLADEAPLPVELGEVPPERYGAPVETAAYLTVAEAIADAAGRRATFVSVDVARENAASSSSRSETTAPQRTLGARPHRRPRRRARRLARGRAARLSGRRSRASSRRRRRHAHPRGDRPPARGRGDRRGRARRRTRTACSATFGSPDPTPRSSTSACRRRTPTRASSPRSGSAPSIPEVGVLVLSQYVEPSYAMRLLEEHPERVGYLLKERVFDVAILVDALRRLADGETVIDPTIVSRLVGRRRREDPLAELTEREREVLGARRRRAVEQGDRRRGSSSPSAPSRPT